MRKLIQVYFCPPPLPCSSTSTLHYSFHLNPPFVPLPPSPISPTSTLPFSSHFHTLLLHSFLLFPFSLSATLTCFTRSTLPCSSLFHPTCCSHFHFSLHLSTSRPPLFLFLPPSPVPLTSTLPCSSRFHLSEFLLLPLSPVLLTFILPSSSHFQCSQFFPLPPSPVPLNSTPPQFLSLPLSPVPPTSTLPCSSNFHPPLFLLVPPHSLHLTKLNLYCYTRSLEGTYYNLFL